MHIVKVLSDACQLQGSFTACIHATKTNSRHLSTLLMPMLMMVTFIMLWLRTELISIAATSLLNGLSEITAQMLGINCLMPVCVCTHTISQVGFF